MESQENNFLIANHNTRNELPGLVNFGKDSKNKTKISLFDSLKQIVTFV